MHTAQFSFDGILFIYRTGCGYTTYTLLKVIACMHSHVYLSWSWFNIKQNASNAIKATNLLFVALYCTKFYRSNIRSISPSSLALWKLVSMLKISLPKVLLYSFPQCEKFWNMELCTVVFCMFHTKYQCISLESLLPIYQTMIHYKQSKACLIFSYFHQFLELVEEDENPGALQLCLVSFCVLWHQTGGLFSEQFTDPSVIK